MEADWAVEIGPGLPVIEPAWPGYIDLQANPSAIDALPEARALPALADALRILNQPGSPLFTSKCDAWPLDPADLDPFEYDSTPAACRAGHACYADITARDPQLFASFPHHESWARAAVALLRAQPLSHGRVDLVIRAAEYPESLSDSRPAASGYGLTLYAAACAPDAPSAREALAPLLRLAAVTMMKTYPGE